MSNWGNIVPSPLIAGRNNGGGGNANAPSIGFSAIAAAATATTTATMTATTNVINTDDHAAPADASSAPFNNIASRANASSATNATTTHAAASLPSSAGAVVGGMPARVGGIGGGTFDYGAAQPPARLQPPSDVRPDFGGGFPLLGAFQPYGGRTGGGGGGAPFFGGMNGGGMMMGPGAFRGPGGGVIDVGGRHGAPRFDPIGPNIRDPDILRGMGPPSSFAPFGGGGGAGFGAAPSFPGEPDNDALQPVRFGYGGAPYGGAVPMPPVRGDGGTSNSNTAGPAMTAQQAGGGGAAAVDAAAAGVPATTARPSGNPSADVPTGIC